MKQVMMMVAAIGLMASAYGCGGSAQADTPAIPQVAGNYVCIKNCNFGDLPPKEVFASGFIVTQNMATINIFGSWSFACKGDIDSTGAVTADCLISGNNPNIEKSSPILTFSGDTANLTFFPPNTDPAVIASAQPVIYSRL